MGDFWTLFLMFTIYSFLGWITESIFCSVPAKKFINRGFLNGPFCPIYGVGGILILSILAPFQHNIFLLYFAGVIITTVLEYITGFALEKIFHTSYWDYSEHKFNYKGRICLDNSLLFGLMCVVGIYVLQPTLLRLVAMIPANLLPVISIVFLIYFVCDTIVTVHTILQLNGKLKELQQILDEIKQKASAYKTETIESIQAAFGNLLDEDAKAYLKSLFEKKEKIETGSKALQRRLINAFPEMKSITNNESLQRIKKAIYEKTQRIKKK